MSEFQNLIEREQKRLDLLKKLNQLDEKFRRELKAVIDDSGVDPSVLGFSLENAGLVGIMLRGSGGPYANMSIPEATREFLLTRPNKSATTPEIADALKAGGKGTNAKNFTATIYTILSQTPKWFKRRGNIWILTSEAAR